MDFPFRFGKGFDVNYSLSSGYWQKTNNGRIWNLTFKSEGAYSLNFIFSELYLPEGGELYIYNSEGTMVYGPVLKEQNLIKGLFLTDLIKGDEVTIHIFEPEYAESKTRLKISRVVHAYKNTYADISSNLKSAQLDCHNNIDCHLGWANQSDGVIFILLSGGDAVCSGSLLNNTANDYTPYVLTANHCLSSSQPNWLFKFSYKENDCGGMDNYIARTYNGSTLKSSGAKTDFALLEMAVSPIGNKHVTFLGWDNRGNNPASGTCIHHPEGDYMKISFDNNSLTTNSSPINWDDETTSLASTHWVAGLDDGAIERGSSGSPLFNQDKRVVGQLHGGEIKCPPATAYYGRFDLSWENNSNYSSQLAHWLDPNNTGNSITNLLRSPSITVPHVICYSGTTVSIQNAPDTTIIWGGDYVHYPYGNIGNSVTVRATSSTTARLGTVTASFTVNGIQRTISRDVWVGKPASSGLSVVKYMSTPSCVEDDVYTPNQNTFVVTNSNGETSPVEIENSYGAEVYNVGDYSPSATVTTPMFYITKALNNTNDFVYIKVRVEGECGWSNWRTVSIPICSSGYYLSVTPNPSNGETSITIKKEIFEENNPKLASSKNTFDVETEWELEVYSTMQRLKTKQTKIKTKEIKLNTQGWKEGVYTVRARYKGEVLTAKLVVK